MIREGEFTLFENGPQTLYSGAVYMSVEAGEIRQSGETANLTETVVLQPRLTCRL